MEGGGFPGLEDPLPVHPGSLNAYERYGWTAPGLRAEGLEPVWAELFVQAGANVADRAAREQAGRAELEAIFRRAAEQAAEALADRRQDDGDAG